MAKRHETSATPAPNEQPVNPELFGEAIGPIAGELLRLSPDELQKFIVGRKKKFATDFRKLFGDGRDLVATGKPTETVNDQLDLRATLRRWHEFDKRFFPDYVTWDPETIPIPTYQQGFNWPIVSPRRLGMNTLITRMRKEFSVYTYEDNLDTGFIHDRLAVGRSYVVLCRDRVEADEELADKSANDLAELNIPCLTLPEYSRLKFFYWFETGKHLDMQNWTRCAGSRFPNGLVPYVGWYSDRFRVDWCNPTNSNPYIRGRAAVS